MLRAHATSFGLVVVGLAGCTSRSETFFSCKACLSDDAGRCATYAPDCGDSAERASSETAARDALCDTLGPAELARRAPSAGFKPTPWAKNACYEWPAGAFTVSCTRFVKQCDGVPIH